MNLVAEVELPPARVCSSCNYLPDSLYKLMGGCSLLKFTPISQVADISLYMNGFLLAKEANLIKMSATLEIIVLSKTKDEANLKVFRCPRSFQS